MRKEKYDITGMSCAACSSRVEKTVSRLEGMQVCNVNLLTNSMQVEYDEEMLSKDDIVKAVDGAGYGASPVQAQNNTAKGKAVQRAERESIKNKAQEAAKDMKLSSVDRKSVV